MFAGFRRIDKARIRETHRRIRERALSDRGLIRHDPPSKIENVVQLIRRASAYVGGRSVKVAPMVLPTTGRILSRDRPAAAPRPIADAVAEVRDEVQAIVLQRTEPDQAAALSRDELARQIGALVREILGELNKRLNVAELGQLVELLLDEIVGFGPLEPLLADETVGAVLVNGPDKVFVSRDGTLERSDARFRDAAHLLDITGRVAARVDRRIDEAHPLIDARLPDGSRVNIVVPPLAVDGPSLCIRTVNRRRPSFEQLVGQGWLTDEMAALLENAIRCRLNMLVSGGAGAGKSTMLNAIADLVDAKARLVVVEQVAELRLRHPHVVRMECQPGDPDGAGGASIRNLLVNALRMRPDRIILGEVRGDEAPDLLSAMNTGHDGSLATIRADSPGDALTRLETLVTMAGVDLPDRAVRTRIATALDLVIQLDRLRDGKPRVTRITEVLGMQGGAIATQDLFTFELTGKGLDRSRVGAFKNCGVPPHFIERANIYGPEDE